ncbi:DUF3324 domain-containing protein [Lactobacillus sp. CC-MHH1034]|uniref:DUF916 and DUF3324 domain-containing protein n=1 Tax=Agrilactobacillus fermenti TaxID=2586909 RepID=UPI001E529FA8|nr:DUF916 and DUF3324 domain-containing protein [Agrilactobacillus fermenti]MCD2256535.1 DUF3324 domain-containing protein [Agrilactobacillus fermenti]
MKKSYYGLIALIVAIVTLGFVSLPSMAYGATDDVQNAAGFKVRAVLPDNQPNKALNYFDLSVDPGQTQVLEVELFNLRDEALTFTPRLNVATTNYNGVVNYDSAGKSDRSLQYKITDIARLEQKTYRVPANKSVIVRVDLAMPNTSFPGVIAGGLTFTPRVANTSSSTNNSGRAALEVQNRFAYTIALLLRSSAATATTVAPEFKMGTIDLGHITERNTIFANIRNTQPMYLAPVNMQAKVTRKGSTKVLYQHQKENVQVAPNTIVPFPISLNQQRFAPGLYTMAIQLRAGTQTWYFNKDFRITAQRARDLNRASVAAPTQEHNYWWLWLIAALILIAGIIFWVVYRRKKQEAERLRAQLQQQRTRKDK